MPRPAPTPTVSSPARPLPRPRSGSPPTATSSRPPEIERPRTDGASVPHRREENDLADVAGAREDDHEAVDPEADATCWRHALLERLDKSLVVGLRVGVPAA